MRNKNYVVLFISIILLVVGCHSLVTKENVIESTPDLILKSATPFPATKTQLSTKYNTPTVITPTIVSSTLSSIERISTEVSLMSNQNGCYYPCWWGINPGITSIESALSLLTPLMVKSYPFLKNDKYPGFLIKVPNLKDNGKTFGVYLFLNDNDLVGSMSVPYINPKSPYNFLSLSDSLSEFGEPSEIFISFSGDTIAQNPTFAMILLYSHLGLSTVIPEANGKFIESNKVIQVCMAELQEPIIWLHLWSTSEIPTLQKVINHTYDDPEGRQFLQIFDVNAMTTKQFYETFINPTSSICIQTPVDRWLIVNP